MKNLKELRVEIDRVDGKLLGLLAERMELVEQVGEVKNKLNLALLDESRWLMVLKDRAKRGKYYGLGYRFTESFWNLIHQETLKIEEKQCRQKN